MKLSTHTVALTFFSSVHAAVVPSHYQSVLADMSFTNDKVPGHNHAYYTQVKANDQLFTVRELVIYPNPPALNEHLFVYLDGWIEEKSLPGLENATFQLSGACPTQGSSEWKITDVERPVVRHKNERGGHDYGGPLRFDENEMLYDQFMLYFIPHDPQKWDCSIEITTRLPDRRILFSFAQNFTMQWPPVQS